MLEERVTSLKIVYESVRSQDLQLGRKVWEVYFCIVIGYSNNLKQTQNHKQNKKPEGLLWTLSLNMFSKHMDSMWIVCSISSQSPVLIVLKAEAAPPLLLMVASRHWGKEHWGRDPSEGCKSVVNSR